MAPPPCPKILPIKETLNNPVITGMAVKSMTALRSTGSWAAQARRIVHPAISDAAIPAIRRTDRSSVMAMFPVKMVNSLGQTRASTHRASTAAPIQQAIFIICIFFELFMILSFISPIGL